MAKTKRRIIGRFGEVSRGGNSTYENEDKHKRFACVSESEGRKILQADNTEFIEFLFELLLFH